MRAAGWRHKPLMRRLAFCAVLLVSTVCVHAADPATLFQRGANHLNRGEAAKALIAFSTVPDSTAVHMGRAAALLDLGEPGKALTELDRALELDPTREAHIRLMRAIAYDLLGDETEARRELERGRSVAGSDTLRSLYDRFTISDSKREEPDEFGYGITLGLGWTDNATRRPSRVDFGDGVSDEDAFVLSLSGNAWAWLAGGDTWDLKLNARGSHASYLDRTDYDSSSLAAGVSLEWAAVPDRLNITTDLNQEESFFGRDTLGRSSGLRLGAELTQSGTTLELDARDRDFEFSEDSEEDRDGVIRTATLRQSLYLKILGRSLEFNPFISIGDESTDGASLDNDFWRVGGFARAPVAKSLYFYTELSLLEREFDNPNVRNGFADERDDTIQSISTGLQWFGNPGTVYTLFWNNLDQESNIDDFEYHRNLLALYVSLSG